MESESDAAALRRVKTDMACCEDRWCVLLGNGGLHGRVHRFGGGKDVLLRWLDGNRKGEEKMYFSSLVVLGSMLRSERACCEVE